MPIRAQKPDSWGNHRTGVNAADTMTVVADLPAGKRGLRAGTSHIGVTALFSALNQSCVVQLWGRLKASGHAVPVGDLITLTGRSETHAAVSGKYISNAELCLVWLYSQIFFQIVTAPLSGTVDILVTEDTDGEGGVQP